MGRKISYSDAELAWLEKRADLPRRELYKRFCKAFSRTDVSVDNIKSLCTRKGWKTGRNGRFEPGSVPANKGKKMPYNANSARTQFKKGERRGRANKQYKPIGTERVTIDGYIERKIHNELPMQSRWKAVHVIRWEAQNGPVPKDHCLKCIDGNKGNTDPENWICIPRALLPRLNGRWNGLKFDDAEPELKPYILEVARLKNAARNAKRSDD
ncbi:MAG: HNH endonuclease [Pseudomonadota bacterium]